MIKKQFFVSEIYRCLQGEGINIGVPSILLRLQLCNLRCTFCDTPYTHTIKSDNNIKKMTHYQIKEAILNIKTPAVKNLIISGGEPTMQPIHEIFQLFANIFSFEVESNGYFIPHKKFKSFSYADYFLAGWNISFKGNNAGEKINEDAFYFWSLLSKEHDKVFFKFVVRKQFLHADVEEIKKFVRLGKISPSKVILMPEGTSIESQIKNIELHNIALNEGFRFVPRLHVLLFDNKRGV